MDARRIVLGDWPPRLLRDPLDVLRWALVVGIPIAVLRGDASGAVFLVAGAVGVWAVRPVLLPRLLDAAWVLALSITGWGEASGFYDQFAWFDSVVHVVVPLLTAPVASIALSRADVLPDPAHPAPGTQANWALWFVTFSVGVTIGALWEVVEFAADAAFDAGLQESNADTVRDLIADASGAALGALLLLVWTRRSWGSVRRIPGENRREATEG